ncbi:hypothetical protein GCM10007049_00070 [Echinicola pacifica]|uniref:HTH luxR-type domain-containing protein n=1 Tax=Echinicola pacifica TaxID=346377 RepID=A0A918PK48_9BACT|nr:hypothetical protein [Echinicola pacifica]GGZ12372.1 hypothetical protein GCM10007049_00070 [Echinicola pacifica]
MTQDLLINPKKLQAHTLVYVFIMVFGMISIQNTYAIQSPPQGIYQKERCQEGDSLKYLNPEAALKAFRICKNELLANGDTLGAIDIINRISNIHGNHARYKDAYDNYWEALDLASTANLEYAQGTIYYKIGQTYGYYKKMNKALNYLNISLQINKKLVREQKIHKNELISNYLGMVALFRQNEMPFEAKKYLDSCFQILPSTVKPQESPYVFFEKAYVLGQTGRPGEAIEINKDLVPWFQTNVPSYLVLVYSYLADYYRAINDYQKSENYYLQSLETSTKYHSHIDFSSLVHKKLSDLYAQTNQFKKAYTSLWEAKKLDDDFFDSRSPNNTGLLEIQDLFRLEKEKQQKLLQQQRLETLEHKDRVSFLQKVILAIIIIFGAFMGAVYIRNRTKKFKAEKKYLEKKRALEVQKTKEVLEVKNKELIASTVQLIEKDELLMDIKLQLKEIKKDDQKVPVNTLIKNIDLHSHRNWDEFEKRFIQINTGFYDRLKEHFPKLNHNDHRLCALIKLNMSSKEMASLLAISVESIHTNRYRLRKKLNLERSVNLEDFIANL